MSKIKKNDIFSTIRSIIWPIEGYENKKFVPMALMMFCILLNYATFRSIKDSFVVTSIGPEAISFIKTYFVLPSALLFIIAYIKLSNVFKEVRVFYLIVCFFLGYFALFTFFLYPYPELIHPNPDLINQLSIKYPYFKWFIKIIGQWSFVSFYVMSELWGSVMLSLLFWQFANKITTTAEAKRFYPMFGLLGNLGLPVGGYFISFCLGKNIDLVPEKIKYIPLLVILLISSLFIILIYWFMIKYVLTDPRLYDTANKVNKKSKVKLSLTESFKMIITSKYLAFIVLLIISYGISVNLAEGIWKAKVGELYQTKEAYTLYMGNFQIWQGYINILFMLIGSNILRRVSWSIAAAMTPLLMLITGIFFFVFIFFDQNIGTYLAAIFGSTPLTVAVMIGSIQNILIKGTKYALFDATKEMSYIPLDDELKSKGKAAVEVIGGRFGKSGGAFITSTTFMLFHHQSFDTVVPYFACIFVVIIFIWLFAVKGLSTEYQKKN